MKVTRAQKLYRTNLAAFLIILPPAVMHKGEHLCSLFAYISRSPPAGRKTTSYDEHDIKSAVT